MGIIEEIQEEVRALRKEVTELRSMINNRKGVQRDWLKVSDLAKKYGVSPDAVDTWLPMMAEAGYPVTIARVAETSPRLVHVEQFHRAFMELFAKHTHQ